MKLIKIDYCNFRNFKNQGKVEFSTDGKVTIIYGSNGAGKTTFHQLFHWIIYGTIHFNDTAGDELYNTTFNHDCPLNKEFDVWGSIDFEHNNDLFMMKRVQTYKKGLYDTVKVRSKFDILRKNSNGDWIPLKNPNEIIEQLLPQGLSQYFFFDGERMIADLGKKGKDSAKSLKNALYLMLDLSVYDRAIDYIGTKDTKTSVLGTLFMSKTNSVDSSQELADLGYKMEEAQRKRDALQIKYDALELQLENTNKRLIDISEQIGAAKSQEEYENERNELIEDRDTFETSMKEQFKNFGFQLMDVLPKLFMSKAIKDASEELKAEMNSNHLIEGLDRRLVDSLLSTTTCICGNPLCEKEKNLLASYYDYLPPKRYDSLYYSFSAQAENWGRNFNKETFETPIINVLKLNRKFEQKDKAIRELDKKMKEDIQFEKLIDERINLESEQIDLETQKSNCYSELTKAKLLVNKLENIIQTKSSTLKSNELIDRKIRIMTDLKKYYEELLEEKSIIYSERLSNEIQLLLDTMLEARNRTVEISKNFTLIVKDQYGNEAKSEGQFATISFAYIAGLFKLLKGEEVLKNKEYPLVLDAPFSKLTNESRQKVIETVPNYAPQIILMSKDNLQDSLPKNSIGKVYTIKTNADFNIAEIEEGFTYGI